MEVTISYKGSVIASLDETDDVTLDTAGTYCEDDILIEYTRPEPVLQSKSVSVSESPQTVQPSSGYDGLSEVLVGAVSPSYVGSGVTRKAAQTYTPTTSDQTIAASQYLTGAQTITGDANLVASNIKSGVSIFGVDGSLTSASGGGGGLVYEEGTYEPTADASSPSISFANAHSGRPFFVCIYDTTGDVMASNSIIYWEFISTFDLYGYIPITANSYIYGTIKYYRKATSTSATNSLFANEEAINSFITSSGFEAFSSSYYFRANRTYKWIAVWKPTV